MADDHAIFRDGLRKLIDGDEDITIVGEAQNGTECIKLLAKLKPDILLLDLRMPEKDGLAVLEEVNFDTIPTRVIVLTAAEDDRDVVRAMRTAGHRARFRRAPPPGRSDRPARRCRGICRRAGRSSRPRRCGHRPGRDRGPDSCPARGRYGDRAWGTGPIWRRLYMEATLCGGDLGILEHAGQVAAPNHTMTRPDRMAIATASSRPLAPSFSVSEAT